MDFRLPAEGDLQRCIQAYLSECYQRRSPPRIGELANRLRLHPAVVRRRMQRLLGMGASRFLKLSQLRFACALLGDSSLAIAEIAGYAAFGSRRSFLRAFQRELKQTPNAYRRSTKMSLDSIPEATDLSSSQNR